MTPDSSSVAADSEHIYLTSDELEEVELRSIDFELVQRSPVRRLRQRCAIFNESYLAVEIVRKRARPRAHWLNLAFLDPAPVHERRVDRRWFAIACGAALLTAGLIAYPFLGGIAAPLWRWIAAAGGVGLAATAAALWIGLYRSYDRLVFYTRHGRVRALVLFRRKPGRAEAGRFVAELQRRIRHARAERSTNRAHYLRDEMKEHRRLLAQGLLPPEAFERAKTLILRAHG